MKKLITVILGIALVATTNMPAQAGTTLTGQGSSYVDPLMQTCKASATAVSVTYVASGSGAGKTQFANGSLDFAATDSAYSETDIKPTFAYGYIPIAGGPVAIVFNVKGVKNLKLTNKIVSDIYTGKIKTWNDKVIVAVNAGVKLPATKITPVFRSDGSGTSANFTSYLAATVKNVGWKPSSTSFIESNSKSKISGIGAPKSSGVSTTVKGLDGSIAYLDLADANAMRLTYASFKNEFGVFIKPTVMNASAFINVQKVEPSGLVKFDYTKKLKGGYNLSLVSYALVPLDKRANSASLKTFFTTLVNQCAPANASKLGYAVIASTMKIYARKTIDLIGTK